ncbi:uncharacterized protein TrAtP1_007392 [Trichoderma atroviride]|uniref:uncharacterized protein n=1 Tax=Hypocrea atroviridis TaxID=63577 RepID=UPI003321E6C5|nr:hypothetical protein TrAtP1_007392 [Trichoderma atroviride]
MCSRYSNSEGSIALSGNGERFIIGFDEGIIQVWESRTGHLLKERQYEHPSGEYFMIRAISLNGEQIACTIQKVHELEDELEDECIIHAENLSTGALREFCSLDSRVFDLALSQNGKRLATIGLYWSGDIWDVVTGVHLAAFSCDDEPPRPIWDLTPGFINLDFTETADSPELEEWEDYLAKYYISRDGVWIIRNGKKLLWIPPQYRPKDAFASGSNIAIKRKLGRPFVIGFSDKGLDGL